MRKNNDEAIVEIPLSLLLSLIENRRVYGLDTNYSEDNTKYEEEEEEK